MIDQNWVGNWSYTWTKNALENQNTDVNKISGLPGQGNPNPLAIFPNHAVDQVIIDGNTILFDPSYGKQYTGNTLDNRVLAFQSASVTYFSTIGKNFADNQIAVIIL